MARMAVSKLYLGHRLEQDCTNPGGQRVIFRSTTEPTEATHGKEYSHVVGPFRTKAGAEFMRDFGKGNPHCRCVAEAEKLAANQKARLRRLENGATAINDKLVSMGMGVV